MGSLPKLVIGRKMPLKKYKIEDSLLILIYVEMVTTH